MHAYLRLAQERREAVIKAIQELVDCESPSRDAAAVNRCVSCIADQASGIAKVRRVRARGVGDHLELTFSLPGKRKNGEILLLGHSDTVWPVGTLSAMPFRRRQGRVFGPGVLDMKSGVAFALEAVRILRELDVRVSRRLTMLIVSDEEIGSITSRPLTEAAAKRCDAVLVLEPGSGLEGKLKTARKGVGRYTLGVTGRAAHAGVDFIRGASAIVELARQIIAVSEWSDTDRGITVNAGVVRGGTVSNMVADHAEAEIDVRVITTRDEQAIQRRMSSLKPYDRRCVLNVTGGPNRPPMQRSRQIATLFKRAQTLAHELGVGIEESSTGGGSDGNFTAALAIPTLDGLGGVGEGAHAPHESILENRIADRVALLASLVAGL